MMRKRAGSAPDREGVIAAAKSPPSVVRRIVPKDTWTPMARAEKWIFTTRNSTSSPNAPRQSRCAHQGSPSGAPSSGQLEAMTYADAPNVTRNESAVRSQRNGVKKSGGEGAAIYRKRRCG